MNRRFVVDEDGERVAVLLDIDEYECLIALPGDETLDDEEDLDPEEAECRITQFITCAEELPGPPVAELGEEVAELMRIAWRDVAEVLDGKPHNKVLAVQLLLSRRARELQPDDHEKWRLSAATTLLGGMISAPPRHNGM